MGDAQMTAGPQTDLKVMVDAVEARLRSHKEFRRELEHLINRYSMEFESGTPDFILADFLMNQLDAFNEATLRRGDYKEATRG